MKTSLPAYCYYRNRSGGQVYVYFEKGGQSARIKAEPGTAAFALEYANQSRAFGIAAQTSEQRLGHMENEPKTSELLPCPFCGSLDVMSVPVEDDPDYDADYDVVLECMGCGSRGPTDEHKTAEAAYAAWNRRPQPEQEKS